MKTLITAIVLALTPLTAQAYVAEDQQETYELWTGIVNETMTCTFYGEEISRDHLEELVTSVGEKKANEFLELIDFNVSQSTYVYTTVVIDKESGLNKLYQKRFHNHYYDSMFDIMEISAELVERDLNELGMKKSVEKYMNKCSKYA